VGEQIDDLAGFPNEDVLMPQMLSITRQHQLCHEIADDLALIHAAALAGVESAFVRYLEESYQAGRVPDTWKD
jgi:hypothetical protein